MEGEGRTAHNTHTERTEGNGEAAEKSGGGENGGTNMGVERHDSAAFEMALCTVVSRGQASLRATLHSRCTHRAKHGRRAEGVGREREEGWNSWQFVADPCHSNYALSPHTRTDPCLTRCAISRSPPWPL